MRRELKIAPKNSLVLIMDRTVGVVPDTLGGKLFAATSSCLALGTRSEHDGETSITLSDEGAPPGLGDAPALDGMFGTPSRVLSICSILDDVYLEMDVPTETTRVQVWANHPTEPDVIAVVVVQ